MHCPHCQSDVPADALFCIHCATPLKAPQEEQAATGPTVRLDTLPPPPIPGARPAPAPQPLQPTRQRHHKRRHRHHNGTGACGIFLIGLGILLLTSFWWPGILILLALTHFARTSGYAGAPYISRGALFFFGLAILAWTHAWWPGILFLLGLLALYRPNRGWGRP